MRKIIIPILLLNILLTGSKKQPEDTYNSDSIRMDPVALAQFDKSDKKIESFLAQLENPNTSLEIRKKILCTDYAAEYKKNYLPALLKISPEIYTKKDLYMDLYTVLDYYKKKYNIKC